MTQDKTFTMNGIIACFTQNNPSYPDLTLMVKDPDQDLWKRAADIVHDDLGWKCKGVTMEGGYGRADEIATHAAMPTSQELSLETLEHVADNVTRHLREVHDEVCARILQQNRLAQELTNVKEAFLRKHA